jgi:hypothetical protein
MINEKFLIFLLFCLTNNILVHAELNGLTNEEWHSLTFYDLKSLDESLRLRELGELDSSLDSKTFIMNARREILRLQEDAKSKKLSVEELFKRASQNEDLVAMGFNTNKINNAISDLHTILVLSPNHTMAMLYLAEIYFNLNKNSLAQAWAEKALIRIPIEDINEAKEDDILRWILSTLANSNSSLNKPFLELVKSKHIRLACAVYIESLLQNNKSLYSKSKQLRYLNRINDFLALSELNDIVKSHMENTWKFRKELLQMDYEYPSVLDSFLLYPPNEHKLKFQQPTLVKNKWIVRIINNCGFRVIFKTQNGNYRLQPHESVDIESDNEQKIKIYFFKLYNNIQQKVYSLDTIIKPEERKIDSYDDLIKQELIMAGIPTYEFKTEADAGVSTSTLKIDLYKVKSP